MKFIHGIYNNNNNTEKIKMTRKTANTSKTLIDSTVINVEKAVKAVDTSATNILKAAEAFETAKAGYGDLLENIKAAQETLDGLQDQFDVRLREHEAELQLQIKESDRAVLTKLMGTFELAEIGQTELNALRSELEQLKADCQTQIASEVAKQVAIKTSSHKQELATMELTHERDRAADEAKITNLETQVEFLSQQLQVAREEVQAQRRTVEHVAASSKSDVNITNTK